MTAQEATVTELRSTLGLSLFAKILNVGFSVLSTRYLGVENFGDMYVSQSLILSLSLFLMKEAFRREGQRTTLREETAWCSVYISWTCAAIVCLFWVVFWNLPPVIGFILYVAIAVEAMAEPHLYTRLRELKFGCKTTAEIYANLARSGVLALVASHPGLGPLAFATAQLVFAVVWFAFLVSRKVALFKAPGLWMFKEKIPKHTIVLATQKLVLTEAEKFVLLVFFKATDWSVFALVSNFGSLIIRTVFTPIEEVAFASFARGDTKSAVKILALQASVGLGCLCFGPPIADWAVLILYGQTWLGHPGVVSLLQLYCMFIFICSVNGICEALYYARADEKDLAKATKAQPLIAAVQLLVAIVLRQLGPAALVLANLVGMALRIRLCWRAELNLVFVTQRVRVGLSLMLGGAVVWSLPLVRPTAVQRLFCVLAVAAASAVPLGKALVKDFAK
jgi:hypothetical protein